MSVAKIRLSMAVVMLLSASSPGFCESVTLSTYYPSPSGIYTQMITTGRALLARDGGAVGIGVSAPSTKLELAPDTAFKLGNAYLSSGGDFANLSNNEWRDGGSWHAFAPGALFQIAGQDMNFYRHDAAGVHVLEMKLGGASDLNLYGPLMVTQSSVLARDSGNVGVGVAAPAAKLEVANNSAFKLGNAYLSSGGDLVNLANNEFFDGSAWNATASGALIQIAGQTTNFYRHDLAGSHTLSMRLDSAAHLSLYGPISIIDGTQGAGKVLTSNGFGDASWQPAPGAISGPVVYQCPNAKPCCSGGAWGFYGCRGQITTSSTCQTIEYPCSCSTACTYLGHMALAP